MISSAIPGMASDPRSGSGAARHRRRSGRRRTIGFVGNCQAGLLHDAFRGMAPASDFETFYHFFEVPEAARESACADLAGCDDLLMQDIQNLEDYPLHTAIPVGTKIVRFPVLRFASPWPYDDFNGMRDTAARAQDDPERRTTTYYDGVLGRLRRLVPDHQARFEAYKSLDMKGIIDPLRVHDFEARRLEALDERFGCAIGGYILDGFRRTRLFHTVNRPCGVLVAMVLDYISKELRLDLPIPPGEALDELRSIQVPVHPRVARRLSMQWADESTLYTCNGGDTTWESFVRFYIERYG
jgi:hypothetical protein